MGFFDISSCIEDLQIHSLVPKLMIILHSVSSGKINHAIIVRDQSSDQELLIFSLCYNTSISSAIPARSHGK